MPTLEPGFAPSTDGNDPPTPRGTPRGTPWGRVRSLFERAIELPEGERRAFLTAECAGDGALGDLVRSLLRADAEEAGLLDVPLAVTAGSLLADMADDACRPGAVIGAWRLVRELGRGGMGVVYLADRADSAYRQQAALKVVRGSLVSGALEKRFLRERQILARLQHPGIASLLDGGFTPEGQPYFVMERVDGEPITAWSARKQLDVPARLRLFLKVCEAVQYAHRQLVVHRDLKPANILVTEDGHPRLLDFGVARLLDDTAAEGGLTRTGMLLLTPEYAAPEQIRGEPPSTATDVYGLGAVLYELLSGRRVRELPGHSLTAVLESIAAEVPPLAEHAGLTQALRRQFRGDLQTIVHRAVASDPRRRYASVDAFAADIERHLQHRPVLARPDTVGYRLRKYLRRHRAGVTAGAVAAALLVLGVAGTVWQAEEARREAHRAREMSAFLQDLFSSVNPEEARGREVSARELLDIGAARIDELRAAPDVRVDLLLTLGNLYYALGIFDRAESLLSKAEREALAAFPEDDVRTAGTRAALGNVLTDRGRHAEAEALIRRSLATGRESGDPETLGQALEALAHLRFMQGRYREALELRRQVLAMHTQLHGPDSRQAADNLSSVGANELLLENYDEAGRLLTEALRRQRALNGDDHPAVANTLGLLASLQLRQGRPEDAEPLQREALRIRERIFGEEHPDVALSLHQLALSLMRQNRPAEAVELHERALAMRGKTLGPDHPQVADSLTDLATIAFRSGDLERAADRQRQALEIYRRATGEMHPRVANAMSNLGVMLRELGRLPEAKAMLERSLTIRRELLGEEHTEVAVSMLHLSTLYRLTNDLEEAERLAEGALESFAARLPDDHLRVAEARVSFGAALLLSGRADESLAHLERAYASLRDRLAEGDLRLAEGRYWLGAALARLARLAEARSHLEAAHEAYLEQRGPGDAGTRRAAAALQSVSQNPELATAEAES